MRGFQCEKSTFKLTFKYHFATDLIEIKNARVKLYALIENYDDFNNNLKQLLIFPQKQFMNSIVKVHNDHCFFFRKTTFLIDY